MNKQKIRGMSSQNWRFALLVSLLSVLTLVGWRVVQAQAQTIPTITIVGVEQDSSVTIETHNYPANRSFVVTMGKMGTRGVDGYKVQDWNSGAGGMQQVTFDIPEALQGDAQIAIRLQSQEGYYSFNWFYNSSTGATPPGPDPTPVPEPGTIKIPTISISAVERDSTVTIAAKDFPPDREFRVTMGAFGTRGINGTLVGTTDSGKGGDFTSTYDIPEALQGMARIAIRLESADGFYAFNWFYNNDAP